MTPDHIQAIRADAKRAADLLAACIWGITPLPWVARGWPVSGTPHTLWLVHNDAPDAEQYDVFTDPHETVARVAAAAPLLLASLAGNAGLACDEVERLTAERDALKARVAELEAALKPFAQGHLHTDEELPNLPNLDGHTLNPYDLRRSPTVGDCRRAAALLGPAS